MGFVQGAYFWTLLDQEFLNVCEASVVFDLYRFDTGQNGKDGRVSARGVVTSEGCNGGCGLPFGGGAAIIPFLFPRFEVEGDSPAFPFRGWAVGEGMLF